MRLRTIFHPLLPPLCAYTQRNSPFQGFISNLKESDKFGLWGLLRRVEASVNNDIYFGGTYACVLVCTPHHRACAFLVEMQVGAIVVVIVQRWQRTLNPTAIAIERCF